MTELELQELANKVIAKLKDASLTIDQLTQTNVLTGTDFLELNVGRKVSLDDLRKFIRGYGIYLEIISKLDNETMPTDNNVFSSLRVLFEISKALEELKKIYLRKDQDDETKYFLKFLGGAKIGKSLTFGDFITGMQGGYIGEDARAELEALVLRSSLSVPEIRYNRQTYFEGYNTISPGGGLKIKDYVVNEDGSYTVTPDLEEGVPLGQYLDDILLGYWHNKNVTTGDFIGFQKVQYRITSVDYNAKTFVMVPRPGYEFEPHREMRLGQTGNFTNKERQTYIIIDVRDGNCCITYFDEANTWDPEPAQMKSWFGKKKGMKVAGIDCDNYSAVLQNIIMTGLIFQVDEITGQSVRVPIDKGAWVAGKYGYYDRVSHNGALWLCVNDKGTSAEPSESNSDWLKQVSEGATGATGPQGVPGTPGKDGKVTYTWIRYANDVHGNGISNDPTGKTYIGFAYNKATQVESNTPTDYKWSLIKGTDGVPGPAGADGKTTYTWVAYSDYPDGRDMYQLPNENTRYLGIAVNKNTATEGSNPADYKWSLFKGSDGKDGLSVVGGGHWESGKTPYKASTMVSFANCVFLSKVETSNPPIKIARFKNGAFRRKKDGGYILAGKSADWVVHEDWDILLDGRELKGESFNFLGEFASHPANPKNGDTYRNTTDHCTYTYKDGVWKVMLQDGTDGKDGKDYEWIYTRTNIIGLPPEKPDSKQQDDYIPTGWTDDFVGVDADHQVEWACKRVKRDGVWSEFSTPAVVHRWSKDGESNIVADLDNEMENSALTSDGKVVASQTWNTTVNMWYGTEKLTLDSITCAPSANLLCATDKNTGVVTISVSAGVFLASTNNIKVTVRATKNGQQYSRDLIFTVAGVRGGADAILYSIVPSVSSVSKDKNGNYSVSSVSCYRQKSVGGVITTTTEGTLKYSIDGGAETTINNNTGISSGSFTKTLKFIFYVGSQIVDIETIPMLTDGKDGSGITAAGHWESANTPYPKNSTVYFAGGSYLSKVDTYNPPIAISRFKNGSYRRKRDGGYILAGKSADRQVNSDWQEMVAPVDPSASYWIDTPINTINFTHIGTPSPSAFVATMKQNVNSNVSDTNKFYLVARKYNGSWLSHVGATLSNQISVPATAGYTQFAVRAYKSASDANAWNDNFVAEKGIGVAVDGKPGEPGATGATGAMPRDMGVFASGKAYVWNANYRDKIIYMFNGVYYNFLVKNYGASVTTAPTSINGDSNWEAMQKFVNIATDTLFADGANVAGFMFKNKVLKSYNDEGETLLINGETGYFKCKNAEITGTVNATGGVFTGTISLGDIRMVGSGGSAEGIYYKALNTSQNQYGEFSIQPKMFRTVPRDSLMEANNTSLNVLTYMERARDNAYDRALYASGISEFNGRVAISSYNSDRTTADISKAALFVEGIIGVSGGLYGEPVVISSSCTLSPMIDPISGYKKNSLIYLVTGNNITIDIEMINYFCPAGIFMIFITSGNNDWSLQHARGILTRNSAASTRITITGNNEIWWVFFPQKEGVAYAGYFN